jgi:hypothetical protein
LPNAPTNEMIYFMCHSAPPLLPGKPPPVPPGHIPRGSPADPSQAHPPRG